MGGTSFDTCLVLDGRPSVRGEFEVAGWPVLTSAVDLATVGAGGGSVARVDAGGALGVGPESAGALPGPACYGRGGELPTVTDANLVVGRLDAGGFLGGRLRLDVDAAHRAMEDRVAKPLGVSIERAAHAVIEVASATMARALRLVTVGRGHDISRLPLVAFGGAGPLHAGRLANELGAASVLIPPLPGFVSTVGLLATELRTELAETVLRTRRRSPAPSTLKRSAARMARAAVRRLGVDPRIAVVSLAIDCRYEGQGYELTVPLASTTPEHIEEARRRFHSTHDAVYGHAAPGEHVEVVALRVTASAPGAGFHPTPLRPRAAPEPTEVRRVYGGHTWVETAVFDRDGLPPGWSGAGPLLVAEAESTTWIPMGWRVVVDRYGTLEVTRGR
jgi:N-methylhydantoinase A